MSWLDQCLCCPLSLSPLVKNFIFKKKSLGGLSISAPGVLTPNPLQLALIAPPAPWVVRSKPLPLSWSAPLPRRCTRNQSPRRCTRNQLPGRCTRARLPVAVAEPQYPPRSALSPGCASPLTQSSAQFKPHPLLIVHREAVAAGGSADKQRYSLQPVSIAHRIASLSKSVFFSGQYLIPRKSSEKAQHPSLPTGPAEIPNFRVEAASPFSPRRLRHPAASPFGASPTLGENW